MAFKTTTIFHFWSSNSAQPSSCPYIMQTCDCLHYHVFTCVVRLTQCSMSGFPDVGYTTVAHYTLSGELYTFPACPLDRTCVAALPTLKRLQTRVRPNFYCLGLALCNDSMFYTHSLPQYASDWLGSLVLPTGRAFSFLLGLREVPYFTT